MAVTDSGWEYQVRRHPMIPDQFVVLWRQKGAKVWMHVRTVVSLHKASDAMRAHKRWLTAIIRRTGHDGS